MESPFNIDNVKIAFIHESTHNIFYCEDNSFDEIDENDELNLSSLELPGFKCYAQFGICRNISNSHDMYDKYIHGIIPAFTNPEDFSQFRKTYNLIHEKCKVHLSKTVGHRRAYKNFKSPIEIMIEGPSIELGIAPCTIFTNKRGETIDIKTIGNESFYINIKKLRIPMIVDYRYYSKIVLVIVEAVI